MPSPINPSQSNNQNNFTQKPIEQPMLNSELREQFLASANKSVNLAGRLKENYSEKKNFFSQNKFYFLLIFFGLTIILVMAFLAFKKSPAVQPKEANINIKFDVPESLAANSETVYKINIYNQDTQKLKNMQLELAFPDSFVYLDSVPKAENLSGTIYNLADLIPGQNTAVFVKLKAGGELNSQKVVTAKLHYKLANFNSDFIKQAENSVRLIASDIILEIDGPTSVAPGQLVVYNIKYQNNSNQDITDAQIKLTLPTDFNFAAADPPPDSGKDTWNITKLAKGQSANISVQGNFRASLPGESKILSAQFLLQGNKGQYNQQSSASFTTQMSSVPLSVNLQLATTHPTDVINPGDVLIYSIDYQNNNTTAASGVNIVATINGSALDVSTLRAEGAQITGNTITWNAASFSQLESLAPSETGHLTFRVQLKNPATRDNGKNLTVISSVKIKSNEYDNYFSAEPLTLKISSPAKINTELNYLSGSLPPQAGSQTTYKVKISLENSSNDFNNGSLSLFIPLGAGGYSPGININENGKVEYDQSTGKLTWNFGTLPAFSGKFSQAKSLEFNVNINPSASQTGTSPTLIKDIKLQAKDTFTGEDISLSADNLNTADINGSGGFFDGVVQ